MSEVLDTNDLELEELEKQLLEDDFETTENPVSRNGLDNVSRNEANTSMDDQTREQHLFELMRAEAKGKEVSAVKNGELDSSDEEDVRNFLEQKYNEYGRDINQSLKRQEEEIKDRQVLREVKQALSDRTSDQAKIKPSTSFSKKLEPKPTTITSYFEKTPVFTDPVFGMRIKNPLISSSLLLERMKGRTPISMTRIRYHTEQGGDLSKDWVVAGALVSKTVKESQKGAKYSIWSISDLRNEIKMVTVFLFKSAHKDLWKTVEGMVVAILNPSVMDRKDEKKEEAVLSVDNAQKVMLLGESKDLGRCRSKTKAGNPCPAIVNVTDCEYCIYHVKQEYGNASKRSEFQSATAGRGLHELRNKILGKSEVFYAGQSYTAIPAKKNPKQVAKDQHRMMTLSEYYQSPNGATPRDRSKNDSNGVVKKKSGAAERHEINTKQRQKDMARLALLGSLDISVSSQQSVTSSPITANLTQSPQFSQKLTSKITGSAPRLSAGNFTIDLSMTHRQAERAKQKAIELLKKKPLEKTNPNFIKHRGTESGKKRALEELATTPEQAEKKRKVEEDEKTKREKLLAIMNATSSHSDLLEIKEKERQDRYFGTLEKKEAMEEKMMSTKAVACKAVICTKCKYIAFSAADRCKEENHPIKVRDAEKRFFKCKDCGNRTVSLHRIPKLSCKNCHGSRWERTSMMKEKDVKIGEQLSIRGDEEMFIGSIQGNMNLNLLVPEEGTV